MNKFLPHLYPISRFVRIAPCMEACCDIHYAEEHHFYQYVFGRDSKRATSIEAYGHFAHSMRHDIGMVNL